MHPDDTCQDGTMRIPLRGRGGSVRAYAIVDAADAAWMNQWNWFLDSVGYATRNGRRSKGKKAMFRLHRELLGLTLGDGIEVDHINRIRLDCRRSNLRKLPKDGSPNRQNESGRQRSSRYRGVFWSKKGQKWEAFVRFNGTSKYLGRFVREEDAAEAARAARLKLMPYAVD